MSNKREISNQTRAATLELSSFNEQNLTVDVVASTGMAGLRYDWWNDKRYMESLDMDPKSIRLERFNSSAPVLDNHQRYGSMSAKDGSIQVGVIERAWVKDGELCATVKFSRRDDLRGFVQDVKDGIIRNLSIGYNIYAYEVDQSGEIDEYRATDWEPTELSFVPVPFDFKAQTRGSESAPGHDVKITFKNKRAEMSENKDKTTTQEQARADEGKTTTTTTQVDATAEREAGAQAERARAKEIRTLSEMAGFDEAYSQRLIDAGTGIDAARAQIQKDWAEKSSQERTTNNQTAKVTGKDEKDIVREAMSEAILHRAAPSENPIKNERAHDFKHATLIDLAREAVALVDGHSAARRMSPMEVAGRALTTSDFPLLFSNVAKKFLRKAYEAQPSSWKKIANRQDLSDFKSMTGIQFGGPIKFEEVNEHGEFKRQGLTESADTFRLKTYGKIVSMTRQMLINDDLGGFTRLSSLYGAGAANLENGLMWGMLESNPTLGDGTALFHASHGNLAGVGAALSETTLSAARLAMRKQKGLTADEFINVEPKYLIVPPDLETTAQKLLSSVLAASTSNVNIFANSLELIVVPRLTNATAWYVAADPASIDMLMYGYLSGNEGLFTETRNGFDVDGVEVKARLDFGHKIWEHRGLYKNPGA